MSKRLRQRISTRSSVDLDRCEGLVTASPKSLGTDTMSSQNDFDDLFQEYMLSEQVEVEGSLNFSATATWSDIHNFDIHTPNHGLGYNVGSGVVEGYQQFDTFASQPHLTSASQAPLENPVAEWGHLLVAPAPIWQEHFGHENFVTPDTDYFLPAAILTYIDQDGEAWTKNPCCASNGKRSRPESSKSSNKLSLKSSSSAPRKKSRFCQRQTDLLEQWLSHNLDNPFPDKLTKKSLAQATGLTIRQIERWFARTRQRKLKRLQPQEVCSGHDQEATHHDLFNSQRQGHGDSAREGRDQNHAQNKLNASKVGVYACASNVTGRPITLNSTSKGYRLREGPCSFDIEARILCERPAYNRRARSCPPSVEFTYCLQIFKQPTNNPRSAIHEAGSLEVGFTSCPSSHRLSSRSHDPKICNWGSDELSQAHVWHAKDWSIERWLELLPDDPGVFERIIEPASCTQCIEVTERRCNRDTEVRILCSSCMASSVAAIFPHTSMTNDAKEPDFSEEAGSPFSYARSRAGSSAGSAASCTSYASFGSRRGRKVVYGANAPLSNTPPANHSSTAPQGAFRCTFCGKSFRNKYLWQRHEETVHAPPKVWVCGRRFLELSQPWTLKDWGRCSLEDSLSHCSVDCPHKFGACWDKPERERTFFRADAFKQHLLGTHSASILLLKLRGESVTVAEEHLVCPFCGSRSGTWNERVEHVADHFGRGEELPAFVTSSNE